MDTRSKKMNANRIVELRREQDKINLALAGLLRQRLKLSHEILKIKQDQSTPLHDSEREKKILSQVVRGCRDPIFRRHLISCFKFLCEDSRRTFALKENAHTSSPSKLI